MNNYEVAEIVEIGRAQDVILGTNKLEPFVYDGPSLPEKEEITEDE